MEKRNLSLAPRNENTRVITRTIPYSPVLHYELVEIKTHFSETIVEIRKQFNMADDAIAAGKLAEAEYIWRGQIVFLESAFDFFLHEVTKYGLCQIFEENWDETKKYSNLLVKMSTVAKAIKSGKNTEWFLEYINAYYALDTLVSYEAVKEQINLLGLSIQNIADEAFYDIQATEKTKDKLKRRLNELYERRNLIAHQADRRHTDAKMLTITKTIVEEFIKDTELIVDAICNDITNKECR